MSEAQSPQPFWRRPGVIGGAAWVGFLVVMAVRVGVGAAVGGPLNVLLTFVLIAVAALALYWSIVAVIAVRRRPLRELRDELKAQDAAGVFVCAMATDDLLLGLRMVKSESPITQRMIVAGFTGGGLAFYAPAVSGELSVALPEVDVVSMGVEDYRSPIGMRPTLLIKVAGFGREVVLPLLPSTAKGLGLKPMDRYELDAFVAKAQLAVRAEHPGAV